MYRPGAIEINLLAMEQPEKRNREEVSKVVLLKPAKTVPKKDFNFLKFKQRFNFLYY